MGVATLNSPILRIRTLIRHRFYNGQAQWRYACQWGPSRLVANYYSFNGQRIALRQGSKRYNLHTASKEQPLGSTKLITD